MLLTRVPGPERALSQAVSPASGTLSVCPTFTHSYASELAEPLQSSCPALGYAHILSFQMFN